MAVINLDYRQFQEMIRQDRPVLVDFWAPWCGYCRKIEAAYGQIAAAYGENITAAKVNIDEEHLLAEEEQIEVIPTLVLYRNGEAIGSIVAPASRGMIERFIRETLGKQDE